MTEPRPRRRLLITGGSRGIGAATVTLAVEQGYDVVFSFRRNADSASAVCDALAGNSGVLQAVQADLASEADILALWQRAVDVLGHVDVLINNVGVLEQQMQLADMSADRIQRVFAVNAIGSLLCAREAVRHMSTARGGKGGVIINVSSVAARLGAPQEYVDYAASKAALDAMTVGLAREVASQGIRVNGLRPGAVLTDIHADGGEPDRVARVSRHIPMGRGAEPAEIALPLLWLASPEASYVSGSILDVSGGV